MEIQDKRVPVTLLTGFLGAGKTTLLNQLIRDPEAGHVAVIINEFGDVGLDHDLIEEVTEEVMLLRSGCLCCSIRGDLGKTLATLIARRMNGKLNFDRVVIETTGIADPGPILHTLVVDEFIAPHYRMDGVVTLADAATGPFTLDTNIEALNQVAVADLLVLTKTDLVSADEFGRFEARLDGLNKTAKRVRANHGQIPTGMLFGLSAMQPGATSEDIEVWLGSATGQTAHSKPGHHADTHGHGVHHHHESRFCSVSIEVPDPIPANVFDFWLDTLIALRGPNILRIKGIAHIEDIAWPFVFHGVQHIFDPPVPLKSWTGMDKTSRVVVIARDIDREDLEASLAMLRMQPSELETHLNGSTVQAVDTSP
ncbi:MAG: GTP-binding protein [Pseudomonadota bacterium]